MGVAHAHGHIRAPTRTRTPAHTHEAPARTLRSNLHKRLSPWYNPPLHSQIKTPPPIYIFLENTKMHTNVRTEEVVDYAYPAMMAERALKRVHDAALEKDFELAMDEAVNAMAQMRKLHTALCEMQDKQK